MGAALKLQPRQPACRDRDAGLQLPFKHALELLLRHRGDPFSEIERVLTCHPDNVFGHCLRAALIVRNDDIDARADLAASIAAIEANCQGQVDPARRHAAAARAWLQGTPDLAALRYDAIVRDFPHDILALVAAHALDFRANRRPRMQDRIAKLLPRWDASMPGYASVLAMYAFALEENGHYPRAEEMARRALVLDRQHPSAIHVVAHVMEMQGRPHEGLAFLAATESAWVENTSFSVHLAWHRALFHLDANDPQAALATYDSQIANASTSDISALADASALLWRLELRGIDLSERWRILADRWELRSLAGARPFYVVHAMMAFAAAARAARAVGLLEMLPHAETDARSPALPEEALAQPFCEALLAFSRRDYARSLEWLDRVRQFADRCGGSLAQCDLFHLTFAEATARAESTPQCLS